MTSEQAKAAALAQEPVELGGVIYARIGRIIGTPCGGGFEISAELVDKNGRSTSETNIRYINRISPDAPPEVVT